MNINSVWETKKKNVDKILTTRPLKKDLCPSLALSLRTSDNIYIIYIFLTNAREGAHDNIHYNMRYETMTNILHGIIIRTIDVKRYRNPILLL